MRKSLLVAVFLGLAFSLSAPPIAVSKTNGISEQSIEKLEKRAVDGDASAQSELGSMHLRGDGVRKNYREARTWLEKAAAQGIADAQKNLGVMYLQGLGVQKDYAQAVELFEKAAAQGDTNAYNNLGGIQSIHPMIV